MNERTIWTIVGLVVAGAIVVVGGLVLVRIFQDDIWVDPTKGSLTPTRTRSGRLGAEYRAYVGDFFLPPALGMNCDPKDAGRCDYVMCWDDGSDRGTIEYMKYTLSEVPPTVDGGYPRYTIGLTADSASDGPFIRFEIAKVENTYGGPVATQVDLRCCNHDPDGNPTCAERLGHPGPPPACRGTGLPLEMYFPHLPNTEITIKRAEKATEDTVTDPADLEFKYALIWASECP